MFGLGLQELLVLLVIVLIFFGAKRLPEIGKALGKSASELKKAFRGEDKNDSKKPKDGSSGEIK